jgi:hypothetical protein
MITIVTRTGEFSADSVMAVAIVQMHLRGTYDPETGEEDFKVVRIDDAQRIANADYVLGAGGIGFRGPGIDCAAWISGGNSSKPAWESYGESVVKKVILGSSRTKVVADATFDTLICRSNDNNAGDAYSLDSIIRAFNYRDKYAFDDAVYLFKGILIREIMKVNSTLGCNKTNTTK